MYSQLDSKLSGIQSPLMAVHYSVAPDTQRLFLPVPTSVNTNRLKVVDHCVQIIACALDRTSGIQLNFVFTEE